MAPHSDRHCLPRTRTPFATPAVASAFDRIPAEERAVLLQLRERVFACAAATAQVGPISESLKWGAPSYAPVRARTGTPIRLGLHAHRPGDVGLFVHCQSRVVDRFACIHGDRFRFEGTRALVLCAHDPLPEDAVDDFIGIALSYHLRRQDADVSRHAGTPDPHS